MLSFKEEIRIAILNKYKYISSCAIDIGVSKSSLSRMLCSGSALRSSYVLKLTKAGILPIRDLTYTMTGKESLGSLYLVSMTDREFCEWFVSAKANNEPIAFEATTRYTKIWAKN